MKEPPKLPALPAGPAARPAAAVAVGPNGPTLVGRLARPEARSTGAALARLRVFGGRLFF